MKRILTVAFALSLLTANATWAGDLKMYTGTFRGLWGGVKTIYHVETKEGNTSAYTGNLELTETGQYDRMRLVEMADGRVHVTRMLQGKETGKTQALVFYAPQLKKSGDSMSYHYSGTGGTGPGMKNTRSHFDVPKR